MEHLKTLLDLTEGCWYLRRNICFYLFNIYLDTEHDFLEEDKLIEEIAMKLVDDLIVISDGYHSSNVEIWTYKGLVTVKQIKKDYVLNGIVPCFT